MVIAAFALRRVESDGRAGSTLIGKELDTRDGTLLSGIRERRGQSIMQDPEMRS